MGLRVCISSLFPGELRLLCGAHTLSYCPNVCERDIDKLCVAQTAALPFEGLLWGML